MVKRQPVQAGVSKSPELRSEFISELDDRDPFVSWQIVDVQFPEEPNTDFVIPHDLRVQHPRDVHYRVIKQFTNGDIYESANADAKQWTSEFIVLRSDVPKWTGRILLGILKKVLRFATHELDIPEEPPPDCCTEEEEPPTPVPVDCSNVIAWSNEPQRVSTASATVTVTPSLTTWADSAWYELENETDADWVLTGVNVGGGNDGTYFEVDVGVGIAGAEAVIATMPGFVQTRSYGSGYLPFPLPIDNIPEGSRVSVRMRKSNTSATTWRFAITYYKRPLEGAVVATIARAKTTPAGANGIILSNPGGWANGSWVELVPETPNPWVLSGAMISPTGAVAEWEVDIGSGASGSQTVLTTFRSRKKDNTAILGGGFYVNFLMPGREIAVGSQLWARVRSTATGNNRITLLYYEAPNVPALVTEQPQQWLPPAANNLAMASAAGGGAGSWVEFHAGISNAIAITGFTYVCDTTPSSGHIEIAYGSVGMETSVAEIPLTITHPLSGSNNQKTLPIAINIPAGERLIARIYSEVSNHTFGVAIGYIESPDFAQRANDGFSYWRAFSTTDVNLGASWADGAWTELIAENAQTVLLYGMSHEDSSTARDIEVDLGVGLAGFEEVVNTFRFSTGAELYGANFIPMSLPVKITTGERISTRGRSSSGAEGINVLFHYIVMDPPAWDCDGANSSADPDDPDDPVDEEEEGDEEHDAPLPTDAHWEPLTNGYIPDPEILFSMGDVIMVWVTT